jgi:acetyltransferase-like isoleucine patch superfamily enzyme
VFTGPGDPGKQRPVVIEHDVWIGARAVIASGVKIGTGAVIGANSLVQDDVEPYTIVAGSPARVIRRRFDDATIARPDGLPVVGVRSFRPAGARTTPTFRSSSTAWRR